MHLTLRALSALIFSALKAQPEVYALVTGGLIDPQQQQILQEVHQEADRRIKTKRSQELQAQGGYQFDGAQMSFNFST